jgi:hypothetical protein
MTFSSSSTGMSCTVAGSGGNWEILFHRMKNPAPTIPMKRTATETIIINTVFDIRQPPPNNYIDPENIE